jgi:hypothetical protein
MAHRAALVSPAVILAAMAIGPAFAAEPELQSMCAQMASWTPKQLQDVKDADLEKFTCVAAKATFRAAQTKDNAAEGNCRTGLRKLIEEFKRRWPEREPSDVTGKC